MLAIGSAASFAACSATNGNVDPPEVTDAPGVDARVGPDPEAAANDVRTDSPLTDAGDAGGPKIVINEVHVSGAGSQTEYVEIAAPAGTPLAGLKLRRIAANGTTRINDVGENQTDTMPASGVWVVGGATLPGAQIANHVVSNVGTNGWDLDSRGAAQLLRGDPPYEVLDVVGWTNLEDAAAITPPASPPTATSEGTRVVLPTAAGKSIGRRPGAADTDANATDFCRMSATPRAANTSMCDP